MSFQGNSFKFQQIKIHEAFARALNFLMLILSYLPRHAVTGLAYLISQLIYFRAKKFSRRIFMNTQMVYGIPSHSYFAKQFVWQIISHQVICAFETFRIIYRKRGFRVIGLEELQSQIERAEGQGFGHMIITGHVGSWEMVALFGRSVSQKPFHVLAKPSRSKAMTLYLERLREKMGTPVLWNHRKNLIREILSALRRGESVGFVMDQKPEGRKGPIVDFFGRPTPFVGGPAALAIKTKCAVVAVFCLREGPMEYRLLTRTLLAGGHDFEDEVKLSQVMAQEIEGVIRAYPEQWLWNYKRW